MTTTKNNVEPGKTTGSDSSRRDFISKISIAGAAMAVGSALKSTDAFAAISTPRQTEGPFYPVRDQVDKDADMTRLKGSTAVASGTEVLLNGKIVDGDTGALIPGALIEFWQACASGRYNHPRDPNPAPLDPNFQYWAQVRSGASGEFSVKTIKPGAYPASNDWMRPPHIHVKVHAAGYPSLTTQIYFSGEPLNDADAILGALSPADQGLVVIEFTASSATETLQGEWTVYLRRHRERITAPEIGRATPEIE